MTFNHTNDVTIGALVIFTENVNIDEGIINMQTIVVTSITCKNVKKVTSIEVKIISNFTILLFKKHMFQYKYTFSAYYYKISFPIVLVYAVIGHKLGVTIVGNIILHTQEPITPRPTYFMLLKIVENLTL
jgi:hypothetical protein